MLMKDIYFYWGNEEMSFMRYMTLYSFCKLNKDWTVYLVVNNLPSTRILSNTVEKQDKTEYLGKDYSSYLQDLDINYIYFTEDMLDLPKDIVYSMSDIHIKDLLNWKILSEGKGAVADMDILFTSPLTPFINNDTDIGLICFSNFPQKDYIPVSFMYSSKKTEFFTDTYKRALRMYDPSVYESCGTLCIEEKNITAIIAKYTNCVVQHFSDGMIFPLTSYEWSKGISMLYEGDFTSNLYKNSAGIHWYGGAPQSQVFNNIIDESLCVVNTITLKIKEILIL